MMPFWMGCYHHVKTQEQQRRGQYTQQALERELDQELNLSLDPDGTGWLGSRQDLDGSGDDDF